MDRSRPIVRFLRCLPLLGAASLLLARPASAENRPVKTRLRNGIVLITKESHSSHVLAVEAFVRAGAAMDPAGLPGLASFTTRMLLHGTRQRTAEQTTSPVEAIGGTFQTRTERDYSQVLLLSSADALDTDLDLLADVVRNPRFDKAEMEKERGQILTAIQALDNDPGWLVQHEIDRMLYATGPYREGVPGTVEAVKRITQGDLIAFHRRYFTPENLILVVVGNVDRAAVEEKVQRLFADMPASGNPPVAPPASTIAPLAERGGNIVVRERPAELAHVAVGFPVAGVSRGEYPAVLVLNTLLGGGMGSRLMRQVREKQHLGYDLGSFYTQNIGPSYLLAYVRTEPMRPIFASDGFYLTSEMILNKVKNAVVDEFDAVRQQQVPDNELERARRYAMGSFVYDHQRTLNQARYLGWFELVGLGCQYDDELPDLLSRVTKEDVLSVARKYFTRYAVAMVVPEPGPANHDEEQ